MTGPIVRRARMEDAERLGALASAAFVAKFGHLYPAADCAAFVRRTYAAPAMAALLAEPARATWVVEEAGALLAYAMLGPCSLPHAEVSARCMELYRLYTDPGAIGQGWGGRLMREVVMPACVAAEAAGGRAWVGVYSDNAAAIRFYGRYGFAKVGEYLFPVGATDDLEFILRRR